MRWLVGWNGATANAATRRTLHPVGGHLLWGDPDPLWVVGDWRPDEVRVIQADPGNRLAVLGNCGATDEQLKVGLVAARGGALRHLTAWPGNYTAVARIGRRITITADLAGVRPVFHTPWRGGTAYATAALPLADLIEAQFDISHLAALLACPDSPEALGDSTPYSDVHRVAPGHALILREGGSREIASYEPATPLVVAAPPSNADDAIAGVRDALVEAVRVRLDAPRHAPRIDLDDLDPGPVPGMGPAERRAARAAQQGRGPVPGIGADLSGGSASATLALLAAGLPGTPGTLAGTPGTSAGQRLLAVTFNDRTRTGDSPEDPAGRQAELERARLLAENPRLHHVVVAAGPEALPFADLENVTLTDEPAPSLTAVARHRARLSAGSADHLVGLGARQVLDAHPARLADLLLDRRRRHLVRPVAALAKAEAARGPAAVSPVRVPFTVYRAARRLARTPYRQGVEEAAARLRSRTFVDDLDDTVEGALHASLAALTWTRPGPAARWMTGEALAEVALRLEAGALARPSVERPGDRRARAALARQAADHRILEQAVELRGQRLHAPFYDNQVVRACRQLPEALRVRPGARAQVLRSVLDFAGIHELPPGWGATPLPAQDPAQRIGLRTALDPLLDLFHAPLLADAGLVEARVVRDALADAAEGRPLPLDGLADLVATEMWLRRLMARRGSCWTGSSAPRQRAVSAGVVPVSRTLPERPGA
ncbi:asparagine synthase-related protein [Streptomyces sp. NPDC005438]|uniref:asparagine synthase-related protein n=1 Tax=Streptomyces sp. NPDC005438 TaxID=3156880 RepID=UPI0033A2A413